MTNTQKFQFVGRILIGLAILSGLISLIPLLPGTQLLLESVVATAEQHGFAETLERLFEATPTILLVILALWTTSGYWTAVVVSIFAAVIGGGFLREAGGK